MADEKPPEELSTNLSPIAPEENNTEDQASLSGIDINLLYSVNANNPLFLAMESSAKGAVVGRETGMITAVGDNIGRVVRDLNKVCKQQRRLGKEPINIALEWDGKMCAISVIFGYITEKKEETK